MLLVFLMNLGMAAGTAVTPSSPPSSGGFLGDYTSIGGGGGHYTSNYYIEKEERETRERIQIEDSEIMAIVELCLKTTII
jgi:hypothetical protein